MRNGTLPARDKTAMSKPDETIQDSKPKKAKRTKRSKKPSNEMRCPQCGALKAKFRRTCGSAPCKAKEGVKVTEENHRAFNRYWKAKERKGKCLHPLYVPATQTQSESE
jgi:hypothetical protein